MAITCTACTFTMTDAEFAILNEGVAAPTIDPRGSFAGLQSLSGAPITASASAGTTTVVVAASNRNDANIRTLAQRLRRAAQANRITFTA
ncbi:hypothetical protein A4L_37 [Anabaena phage A-4L]|uniref:Uncharacterized protein n=1 Tax=Anabaena phage A-4L TaxID=1357732 RepID=A0A059PY26_9CAUD|nr:hypothetical protein A4L_37 [Anabaena phage A-4L]AGR48564.1 hypothetical protein A4L_37 [Anabaena phage A-4L]